MLGEVRFLASPTIWGESGGVLRGNGVLRGEEV